MKRKRYKFGAVVFMLVLTMLSAILWPAENAKTELRTVTCADDLEGAGIGGVKSFMGGDASGIYFRSLLGRDIATYSEFDTFEDAVKALNSGSVDAIWACDVTAEYAKKKYENLEILDSSDMSETAKLKRPRFSFALAMPNTKENEELKKKLDGVIADMSSDGTLSMLTNDYIHRVTEVEPFYEDDMWSRSDRFRAANEMKGVLEIGITGATPPVELIDEKGNPTGFCVAFLDSIACGLKTDININILDTETAYSQLMSGRVDILFTGAESGNTTQEEKKFLTSTGYLDMYNYKFIVRGKSETDQGNGEIK
ncbi:MAG: transporter substrate-binding domain-containing protein [Lachnospiraceae bacterium]|nr:transporter substrate-binding domain-containing protein [Lachnospiraceae bacterium]